jgi:pyridoxamine 5'-phosphate oxidase
MTSERRGLVESDMHRDPFEQFRSWLDEALSAQLPQPHGMTLATASPAGVPSARMVLLRGFDEAGFCFFTNYGSRKANELAANPHAALVFYWAELDRQVRIEGTVARLTPAESDAYFQTRPKGSRLGAWASPQSQVIAHRHVLDRRMDELIAEFAEAEVPRPDFWGGYRVVPSVIEFWQARPNRLHDRLQYRRESQGGWIIERLAP